jgi:putative aldouronate transport system permease protein
MTIPESLEESARLDGAGDFRILFKIVVPLSTPIIATIVLWTMVGHWNAWFDGLLYITDTKKQVLQTILRQILIVGTINDLINDAFLYHSPEGIKAATIIVATVPILMAYPYLQKYFIKGIMIGSLKG